MLLSCESKEIKNDDGDDSLGFKNLDSLTLQLEQIRVLFPSISQWEEKDVIKYAKDSAIIFDNTGEMLLEKTFSINVEAASTMIVEEQFETTLRVVSSGENHLDMSGLKKYVSPWRVITPDRNGRYLKTSYSNEERTRYPNTSLDEINTYIFNQTSKYKAGGFDWLKYVSQAKSASDFPFNVDISKITLKFNGKFIQTNQPFTKYVVFYLGHQR